MPHIPQVILDQFVPVPGLNHIHQGKVRDTYELPINKRVVMPVVSDRLSIFDFVLPVLVPRKGEVLNAVNHFWTVFLNDQGFALDFVCCGPDMNPYLPPELRDQPWLQKIATIVTRCNPPEEEDIIRFHITGSGWTSYQKDGTICGHDLPPGLRNGDKLPEPIYTPTTKSADDHDEPILVQDVRMYPHKQQRENILLRASKAMHEYALSRGMILADLKWEMDLFGTKIIDERGTPDCSRYWDLQEWEKSNSKDALPPSLDKQIARHVGVLLCIDRDQSGRTRSPKNREDLEYVDSVTFPSDAVRMTSKTYLNFIERLTGKTLEEYQRDVMGIVD